MARPGRDVGRRAGRDGGCRPKFLPTADHLRHQICWRCYTGKINALSSWKVDSEYSEGLAFTVQNEIWSQLQSNYGEAQMFLLFLPLHILLNRPSLLPSLPVPSIWQAAARKPGCIHNSWCKQQLIIHPAITQCTLYWFQTLTLFLFNLYAASSDNRGYIRHAKQSLSITAKP